VSPKDPREPELDEDPDADPENDPAEEEEGQDDVVESPLFAPPGDDDYDQIRYSEGLRDLPAPFSPSEELTRDLLGRTRSAFAVRFSGGGERTGAYEPRAFTERILNAARLNRWVTNSLFQGAEFPWVLATLPGSLIAHFTVPEGEQRVRLGGESQFPSIFGARAVTRLLAYSADEEELLAAVAPLGKRAVRTLLRTFDDAATKELTVHWLTHEGQYTKLEPAEAERGLETLSIVPQMLTRPPVTVVGAVNRPDWAAQRVQLRTLQQRTMNLQYRPHLEDRIREAWHKYIVGDMVVEEPENPSLPRAPARIRTLTRIQGVYEDPEEIPRNYLPPPPRSRPRG
jgi:hypothetical protein